MAQEGPWWCECELRTVGDSGHLFNLLRCCAINTCVGALGTFGNAGHPWCEVIGQYRNQGSSDVKEHRAPSTTLLVKHWAKKRRLRHSQVMEIQDFKKVVTIVYSKYVNPLILGSLSYVHQDRFYSLGKITIGELVAINWKDRNRGWTEFMRLKIKINVSCPQRRVVRLVGRDGAEIIYEVFDTNNARFQYENWLRAIAVAPHQNRAIWRNGIEMVATPTSLNDANDESKLDLREENCNTPNPYLSPD
ncbi:hypothetical protein Golax_014923 [Gossypium laxum]|uniref:Uncharacterized protein n=1 Tax=Gossypium laxum TaxID=34288 RepID=A0A7J8ZW73_9ROSI|nr:hypothetical protein [Gossypium laxum]